MPAMHRLAASLVVRGGPARQHSSPSTISASVVAATSRRPRQFSAAAVARSKETDTGTDSTNATGAALDEGQKKNYKAAKSSQKETDTLSEGHSLDRSKQSRPLQDAHTKQVSNAAKTRDAEAASGNDGAESKSELDAVKLANSSKKANETTSSKKNFQPGEKGEQVGGHAAAGQPLKKQEGMGSKTSAPSNTTLGGLGQAAKNMFGGGPASNFSTFARLRYPGGNGSEAIPEMAVDQGARDTKDDNVKGAQNAHLKHHNAGEGDEMPAVKNDAGLPSKGGKTPDDGPSTTTSDKGPATKTDPSNPSKSGDPEVPNRGSTTSTATTGATGRDGQKRQQSTSAKRPTPGTADTPASRAVDHETGTHSPSHAPNSAQAAYTHVVGSPEPDSYKTKYNYSTSTSSGKVPSGSAPRSSTSNDAYNKATTGYIAKHEEGIGSSNKKLDDPMNQTNEMVDQQVANAEAGQAGDDAGGRGSAGTGGGGVAYAPPPDLAEVEDTLPKPIKK